MTSGLPYAIGAMIAFGICDLIYKRAAAARLDAASLVMRQGWVFCPVITLYAWATGTLHVGPSAAWGSLAGLAAYVAFYNFARSLKDGAISTNAPIFRLNFALTALLAIAILGESLTVAKVAALSCAFVAVWLLLGEPGSARPPWSSLTRVLIATVAMALANFFYKVGLMAGATPETVISAQAWVFASTGTVVGLLHEKRLQLMPRAWIYTTPAAIVLLFAFIFLMYGLALGPASVLVPVAQMSFVFTALIGAVLFRERLNGRKQIGLAIGFAALALFAISAS